MKRRPCWPPRQPQPALLPGGLRLPAGQRLRRRKAGAGPAPYFNGTLDAWGVFTDRSGKVVKRFTVVMECRWQGDDGVLDEDFTYSDGTKQRRIWRLKKLADGRYTGRADDVVGEATGQERGNAFNWTYTLALPVDGKVYEVQFDDWMYLMTTR
jgi:hypothetical protein